MEELLGSSSPWIEAGILLILGVVVAAVVAAVVNRILRKVVDDDQTAGRVSGTVFATLSVVALLVAIGRLAQPSAVESGLAGAATVLLTRIPDLLIAILVAVLGWALAIVLRGTVRRAVEGVRPTWAPTVAASVFWAVLVVTALIVAEQLGVEVALLRSGLLLVLAAGLLAAALAAGLGSRELAAGLAAGRHVARIVAVGDVIALDSIEGTVVMLGHTSVRLATSRGEVEVPNQLLLTAPVRIVSRARDVATEPRYQEP